MSEDTYTTAEEPVTPPSDEVLLQIAERVHRIARVVALHELEKLVMKLGIDSVLHPSVAEYELKIFVGFDRSSAGLGYVNSTSKASLLELFGDNNNEGEEAV